MKWPAHSPDITLCDLFLWDCIKDKVYKLEPGTSEELTQFVIFVLFTKLLLE